MAPAATGCHSAQDKLALSARPFAMSYSRAARPRHLIGAVAHTLRRGSARTRLHACNGQLHSERIHSAGVVNATVSHVNNTWPIQAGAHRRTRCLTLAGRKTPLRASRQRAGCCSARRHRIEQRYFAHLSMIAGSRVCRSVPRIVCSRRTFQSSGRLLRPSPLNWLLVCRAPERPIESRRDFSKSHHMDSSAAQHTHLTLRR